MQASFAGFSALQDVDIQWRTFSPRCEHDDVPADEGEGDAAQLLVRALPDSVRGLWIIDCKYATRPERLENALDGLAAAKALGRFPHLRHVGCEVDAMTKRHSSRGAPAAPGVNSLVFNAQNGIRDTLAACGVVADFGLEWTLLTPVIWVDEKDLNSCWGGGGLWEMPDSNAMALPGEEEDPDL